MNNVLKKCKEKGITLIALVITIIVLLILAGVTIATLTGENGLLGKSNTANEESRKKAAEERMNLKITTAQMKSYAENQTMPTLQYLADELDPEKDNEIEYVDITSRKETASLGKIEIGNNESIFTKLKEYPYEFEIDKDLKLASINGIQLAKDDTDTPTNNNANMIALTTTVTSITGGGFTINVNNVEAHNSGTLYYYVNNNLVHQGTDTSFVVKELNGQPITDNTEYEVKVLADAYSLKITTTEGDNVSSWLACIGNPNTEGYTLNNLNDLFNNTQLMNDLFNSDEAIKYFFKSKNFIIPAAFSNNNAMNAMKNIDKHAVTVPTLSSESDDAFASSKYSNGTLPWKAFDGSTDSRWISNSTDSTGHIGYKFNKNILVYKVAITGWGDKSTEAFNEFYVQSFNGSDWENASSKLKLNMDNDYTTTKEFYLDTCKISNQWRIKAESSVGGAYIGCRELQFYGIDLSN